MVKQSEHPFPMDNSRPPFQPFFRVKEVPIFFLRFSTFDMPSSTFSKIDIEWQIGWRQLHICRFEFFTHEDADRECSSKSHDSERAHRNRAKKRARRILFDDIGNEGDFEDGKKANMLWRPLSTKCRDHKRVASSTGRAQNCPHALVEGQLWENLDIVDPRKMSRGWEFEVAWANPWLPRSELGNAKRLLRKFEAERRVWWRIFYELCNMNHPMLQSR